MIETYITQINDAIKANLKVRAKVQGLAQAVVVSDDEDVVPMISVVGADNLDVFIDDDYTFGLYHKLNTKTYTNLLNKGFGDNARVNCIADMSIICWGFEKYFKGEELEEYIFSLMPEKTRFYSTDFDKKRVFNGEFSGLDFFVNEDTFLFKINYKVEFEIKKSCLTINEKLI